MKIYLLLLAVALCAGAAVAHPSLACRNAPHKSFVRNPSGCSWYYVCMNETAHAKECPPGLVFDVRGKCNFPQDVDCGTCSRFGFQAIRYPDSCRRYIECNNGDRKELECSEGLYFDTELESCNLSHLVDCTTPPATTPDPDPTDIPPVTSPGTEHPGVKPTRPPSPPPTVLPPTETECPPTHSTQSPTAQPPTRPSRPSSTHSPNTTWSVPPTHYPNGTTQWTTIYPDSTRSTTGSGWPTTTWRPTTTRHPNATHPDCPTVLPHPCYQSNNVYVVHESDCTKYYFCFFTVTITRTCPSGLHWNQLVNDCDLPEHAHCIHKVGRRKLSISQLFGAVKGADKLNRDGAEPIISS